MPKKVSLNELKIYDREMKTYTGNAISQHNTSETAHGDIRELIDNLESHDGLIKTPDSAKKAYVTGTTSETENTNKEIFDTGVYLTGNGGLRVTKIEIGIGDNYCTLTYDAGLEATVISFD